MLLNEMEIFYYVVEQQSFSKAAARLNVSKSFISKSINKLEQDLKVRLLTRTTRKLILTDAGKSFYHSCEKMVQEAHNGYSMLSELQGTPAGLLKISMPPALALNLISPMLPKFLKQYPEVILNIQLENQLVDLVKGGYDLAQRAAKLESSNLIAQKIYEIKNIICATPNYLQDHGKIIVPSDLTKHNCAVYSDAKSKDYLNLSKQQQHETIHIQGNVMSNQLDLVKQLVLQDVCIGILPEFMVLKELKTKKLIQCLPEYAVPSSNLYAIYPEREFMLPKVSCFLEMVKNYLI